MPMQIARLGRERTIATLAKRVYRTEAAEPELIRRAEAALLAANPRLSDKESFRSGANVVVPQVPGLEISEAVLTAQAETGGVADEAALRLAALGSALEDGYARGAARRAETAQRLKDSDFTKRARKALPESAEVLEKAAERLGKQAEEAEADRDRLLAAAERAGAAWRRLEELARRAGRR